MPATTGHAEIVRRAREDADALRDKPWNATLSSADIVQISLLCTRGIGLGGVLYHLTAQDWGTALALIATRDDALECYLDLREWLFDAKGESR